MPGACWVTRCSDTAACAPKLDDSANGPGRFSSDQRTRVAASTEASHSLMRAAAAASCANSAGVNASRGASASALPSRRMTIACQRLAHA